VSQSFPGRGPYRILVNTTSSPHRQTGRFTLSLTEGSQTVQPRDTRDCQAPAAAESQPIASIRVGETVNGALSSSDSLYPDNTYFKLYQFTTTAGRPITIDLASDDFDPVLIVRGADLDESIINNNGGPGCAARIAQVFPGNGPYRILVNTSDTPERQTGRFTLSITDGSKLLQTRDDGPCASSGAAASGGGTQPVRRIAVGQTQQGSLARSDVLLSSDSTYAQAWTIQAQAGQTVTIDLESDEFDAYLFLRGPGISGGRDYQDDDSGGNCNARLTATFPQTGEYEIVVNTAGKYATGQFSVSVTTGSKPKSVARCSRSQ